MDMHPFITLIIAAQFTRQLEGGERSNPDVF